MSKGSTQKGDVVTRDAGGLWSRGKSANPSGRPKMPPELKTRIRDLCPKAIDWYRDVLKTPKKFHEATVEKVASIVLDRTYGKVPQAIALTLQDRSDEELETELERRIAIEAADDT